MGTLVHICNWVLATHWRLAPYLWRDGKASPAIQVTREHIVVSYGVWQADDQQNWAEVLSWSILKKKTIISSAFAGLYFLVCEPPVHARNPLRPTLSAFCKACIDCETSGTHGSPVMHERLLAWPEQDDGAVRDQSRLVEETDRLRGWAGHVL